MRNGRCLCDECTYEIDGEPIIVAHCCCIDCQRASGAGHSTGAMFSEEGLHLKGRVATYEVMSGRGNKVARIFCPTCGSPLLGKNTGMPGCVMISAGTMLDSNDLTPQVVIFGRSQRAWDHWFLASRSSMHSQIGSPKTAFRTGA